MATPIGEDKFKGVLNDFDLAIIEPANRTPGGDRTGTILT